MTTYTVTIRELTGAHREWQCRVRAASECEARGRGIRKVFGPRHGLHQDHGLPPGYGSIIYNLSYREMCKRARGAQWAADVVIGRARVSVD